MALVPPRAGALNVTVGAAVYPLPLLVTLRVATLLESIVYESKFARTSGPTLSSYCASRSIAPLLRPGSPCCTSVSEFALMLINAPKLSRKSLPTTTGCAPRAKIVADALNPRPVRSDDASPPALFSTRLWASRSSP